MEKQNVGLNAEATAASTQPQDATSGAGVSTQELLETQINTLAAQVSQLLQAQGLQSQNPIQQTSTSLPNGDTDPNATADNTYNWNQHWDQQSWNWQRGQDWYSGWHSWQSSSNRQTDWNDRPYLSHLKIPDFNGDVKEFLIYSWRVKNLKTQVSPKDYR